MREPEYTADEPWQTQRSRALIQGIARFRYGRLVLAVLLAIFLVVFVLGALG